MGDSCGGSFPEAEGIPSHKVGPFSVGVIKSVEEEGCRWGEEVFDVLLQSIDVLARGFLGYLDY